MEERNERQDSFEYDVALSFAGEQREYVEAVADELRARGMRPFYDDYEKVELWGKDLYEHLHFVYSKAARYCVIFVSSDYADKVWTNHERRSAQERALSENTEYVLPVRFDATPIPGLRETVGYVDAEDLDSVGCAEMIELKLGPRQKSDFFPPVPDKLFESLGATESEEREWAHSLGIRFFDVLGRMSSDERRVVTAVFTEGCDAELPENVHVSLDLLRRVTELPPAEIKKHLAAVRALGFKSSVRPGDDEDDHELMPDDEMILVRWTDLHEVPDEMLERGIEWDTPAAYHASRLARDGYCEFHGNEALERRDFSNLSSATFSAEEHDAADTDEDCSSNENEDADLMIEKDAEQSAGEKRAA